MTGDVVESGPERPPRRWPLAGLAVLVAGAAAYGATRPAEPRDRRPPSPTPTAVTQPEPTPRDLVPPDPDYDDPYAGEWSLPELTERTRLLVAGPGMGLGVRDVDTGRLEQVEPGRLGNVLPVAALDGGWLVLDRTVCERRCDVPVYVVRDSRAVRVTSGETALPDPDGRSIWVTRFGSRPPVSPNRRLLERWSFGGTRLGPRTALRAGENLIGVTPDGPVVADESDAWRPTALVDRDSRDRRVLLRSGAVRSVQGTRLAWTTSGCYVEPVSDCRLLVLDVATGRQTDVARLRTPLMWAALQPSGNALAVAYDHLFDEETEGPGTDAVVVFDVRTGARQRIGVTYPPRADVLTWSPDGRWLLMATTTYAQGSNAGFRLAMWRPGLPNALMLEPWESVGQSAFVATTKP